jgi:DNA-binding transcriptional LysR family regulator
VITAPIVFGRLHALPVVSEFLQHYPGIDVRRVPRAFEPSPAPINLVYTGQAQLPLKLRAFLDFAAPRLKASLARALS